MFHLCQIVHKLLLIKRSDVDNGLHNLLGPVTDNNIKY